MTSDRRLVEQARELERQLRAGASIPADHCDEDADAIRERQDAWLGDDWPADE